jgi:serpin B
MRSCTWISPIIAWCLLGAGCSSESSGKLGPVDNLQDAAAAGSPDTAPASSPDTAPASSPDTAPASSPDAAPASLPDAATADSQVSPPTAEAGPDTEPVVRSPLPRAIPELTDTEKGELATGLSGFAFALLQELHKDPSLEGNFAFSPASISLALGMAYAGAVGDTASHMKDAMQVQTSPEVYFRSLNWLDQQLESRADAALKQAQDLFTRSGNIGSPPDPADFRLHVVNACWGEQTTTFEQPFLDTLATSFGAGIHLADFKNQPETERLAINAWVSQETLNRINDLIPQGAIDPLTRAVLVNAIHLKLPWYDPFLETSTSPGTFTKVDGSTVTVPFMSGGGQRSYAEDDTTQAVAIPLSGQSIDFVVFLPKPTSSLAQLEDSLSQARAQALLASMSTYAVALTLPRFKFTTPSIRLKTVLIALGMTDAFRTDADFTGITKERPLFISDVLHKAMVGVDEHGVEAAAATAVLLSGGSAPGDVKQMDVNRPFFFGIYDRPTSTWLFLGHVSDPSS